jgi:RNA polymerase sigma factor (TIGR02999 family)
LFEGRRGNLAGRRRGSQDKSVRTARLRIGAVAVMLAVMNEVTHLLNTIEDGDPQAAARLLPLVYDELRRLAAQKMAQEKAGQTLQATALVHEAYLRLVGKGDEPSWSSRGHFFAAAAEAMRRILVENARRKQRICHGGSYERLDLDNVDLPAAATPEDVLALDEALERLAQEEPQAVRVVKLRYFAGLTIAQTADALDLSVRTTNRHWSYARAWLYRQLYPSNNG